MTKPATFLTSLLVATATAIVIGSAGPAPEAPTPEVRAIIGKAVERAAWAQEQDFGGRYRQSMTHRTVEFDGDGEVAEDELRGYAVEPHQGVPYAKLVTKNGDPISGDDLDEETERWEKFLETLADPPEADDDDDDDDTNVIFNEDLLNRYTAELVGIREVRGRPAFVLAFEPRPGKLPVHRRIDQALNKSRGEIWIDEETYEIARVTFNLMEPVRLWWGILGRLSEGNGNFERTPISGDAWLATEVDVYFQLRVLFSTSRRRETTVWDAFEPIAD